MSGAFDEESPNHHPLVRLADRIAEEAHRRQVDKAGRPYIAHPRRVAARLSSVEEMATALLHDVVEDCAGWSTARLRAAGVPESVCSAVDALTKREGESIDDYLRRVAADGIAAAVKMADIADNSDPTRLAELDEVTAERLAKKYVAARARLEALMDLSGGVTRVDAER